jgi:hypothetical protein
VIFKIALAILKSYREPLTISKLLTNRLKTFPLRGLGGFKTPSQSHQILAKQYPFQKQSLLQV